MRAIIIKILFYNITITITITYYTLLLYNVVSHDILQYIFIIRHYIITHIIYYITQYDITYISQKNIYPILGKILSSFQKILSVDQAQHGTGNLFSKWLRQWIPKSQWTLLHGSIWSSLQAHYLVAHFHNDPTNLCCIHCGKLKCWVVLLSLVN